MGAHVSIQATGQGSTANGIPYRNEYFFVLRTRSNDDGTNHIISVDEMCDSAAINAFTEKMATASKSG
jgi:ketosteroid isomerase-like protein